MKRATASSILLEAILKPRYGLCTGSIRYPLRFAKLAVALHCHMSCVNPKDIQVIFLVGKGIQFASGFP